MRRATMIGAGLLALLTGAAAGPALAAYGAFAHDETTGKYGYSWNEENEKRAEEAAIKGCASEKCRVVFRTGSGQCGALATSPNGKVWGGATRPKRNDAEKAAVENCEKRPNAGQCKLRGSECNKK